MFEIVLADSLFVLTAFFFLFITLFYLILFFENRKQIRSDPQPKKFPKISFIIPVWNEEKVIAQTIESIKNLTYPNKPFEIIVVDDASTDHTPKILKKIPGIKIITHAVNKGRSAFGKNAGIQLAKHDFIATLDADCIVRKDALMHLMGYFNDPEIAAVASAHFISNPHTIWEHLQKFEYLTMNFVRKSHSLLNGLFSTPGPMSVFRKKDLLRLGGFDEVNLTEDIEMAFHLLSDKKKIAHSVNAVVDVITPNSLTKLFKQRLRWCRGGIQCTLKYKHLLFHKDYSHFGLFIFPFSFVIGTVFLSIFLITSIYNFFTKILFVSAANLYSTFLLMNFNWDVFLAPGFEWTYLITLQNVLFVFMVAVVLVYLYAVLSLFKGFFKWRQIPVLIIFTLYWVFFTGIVWHYAFFKELTHQKANWW